jgi:hypothetical protein
MLLMFDGPRRRGEHNYMLGHNWPHSSEEMTEYSERAESANTIGVNAELNFTSRGTQTRGGVKLGMSLISRDIRTAAEAIVRLPRMNSRLVAMTGEQRDNL